MKKHLTTILLILALVVGLSLLLYPTISDKWNQMHQSRVIEAYDEEVASMSEEEFDALWTAAEKFNEEILDREDPYTLPEEQQEEYASLLDVNGTGLIGYIEIPSIECYLTIYHGTEESVLQQAVGHLDWSSLPVGGESTHSILSGHRGLPSARLFTDLDEVQPGDVFFLKILNRTLTYQVESVYTVEPEDLSRLSIVEGQDLCTLVTCTPYGINSHRLLIRAHRIDNIPGVKSVIVTSDAIQIEPVIVAPVIAIPLLLILWGGLTALDRRKRTEKKIQDE